MLRVCELRVGLTEEALIEETARAYEFKRIGVNIKEALSSAYKRLSDEGILSKIDGRIVLVGR